MFLLIILTVFSRVLSVQSQRTFKFMNKMNNEKDDILFLQNIKQEPEVNFVLLLPPATYEHDEETLRSRKTLRNREKTKIDKIQKLHKVKCDLCPSGFKSKSFLRKHMRKHDKDKRFKCSKCSRKFNQKASLLGHSLTHLKFPSFKCDLCPKEYWSKAGVRAHLMTVHISQTFECKTCGKTFSNRVCWNGHNKYVHGKKKKTFQETSDEYF